MPQGFPKLSMTKHSAEPPSSRRLPGAFSDPFTWVLTAAALALLIGAAIAVQTPTPHGVQSVTRAKALQLSEPPAHLFDTIGSAEDLIRSADQSLRYLRTLNEGARLGFGQMELPASAVIESIEDFVAKLELLGKGDAFADYLKENYLFFRPNAEKTLVTGYYEATLRGSREETAQFRYPLYRVPPDLLIVNPAKLSPRFEAGSLRGRADGQQVVQYYDRHAIDYEGVLRGRHLELVWLEDELERFFLQIQGSGVVLLSGGEVMHVGFADKNGRDYTAIGAVLRDQGLLAPGAISMQSIKGYLRENPAMIPSILSANKSYVFFEERQGGPYGNIGVALTPYRSIATDDQLFPKGSLVFLSTELPSGSSAPSRPFSGFVFNQDTGSAIRSPGRIDLFTGRGDQSEATAGVMKASGSWYFLLKKSAVDRALRQE